MSVTNMDRIRGEYGSVADKHFVGCRTEHRTNIYQILSTNLLQIKFIYCDQECSSNSYFIFPTGYLSFTYYALMAPPTNVINKHGSGLTRFVRSYVST